MKLQSLYLKETQIEKIEKAKGLFTKNFWRRQFQAETTRKQKIFDWIFGIILPVICIFFDPAVFKGMLSHDGALLGHFKPFAYLFSFTSILCLMFLLLLDRKKFGWLNGLFSGLFAVSAVISLLVGIILLPFSLLGIIILVGFLGFTPLFTAFVFARNSIKSLKTALLNTDRILLFNSVAFSAILSLVIPYVFYAKVSDSLNQMKNASPSEIRLYQERFKYISALVNFDEIALKSCGYEKDEQKKQLRLAVYQLTEKNEEEVNRSYCYDW